MLSVVHPYYKRLQEGIFLQGYVRKGAGVTDALYSSTFLSGHPSSYVLMLTLQVCLDSYRG